MEEKKLTKRQMRWYAWNEDCETVYRQIMQYVGKEYYITDRMANAARDMALDKILHNIEPDFEGYRKRLEKITKRDYPGMKRYPGFEEGVTWIEIGGKISQNRYQEFQVGSAEPGRDRKD